MRAALEESLNCDWCRNVDYANCNSVVRQFLGHSPFKTSSRGHRSLIDNASLDTPALLSEVEQLVVEADVRFPTGTALLQDSTRPVIRLNGRLAQASLVAEAAH